jgi:hypothetical protein
MVCLSVIVKPRKMRRPRPPRGCRTIEKKNSSRKFLAFSPYLCVLLTDVVNCQDSIAQTAHERQNMLHWWNDSDREFISIKVISFLSSCRTCFLLLIYPLRTSISSPYSFRISFPSSLSVLPPFLTTLFLSFLPI